MSDTVKKITFVTIAYNEESNLPNLLTELVAQDYPHKDIEVLLIDSNSTDKTRPIMEQFANQDHGFWKVAVLTNPGKYLPHGWNVALEAASGDAIVRVDGHAEIPSDFISKNVSVLNEGHDVCGGLRPTIQNLPTPWSKALLALENSLFGSSIAAYRRAPQAGPVTSIFHGCYRLSVFEEVGLFDERLLRTEDNDMSYRIRSKGFEIWFDPRITSRQKIRPTFLRMLKQKHANGFWIGRTLPVQSGCISSYHLVPCIFVSALFLSVAVGILCQNWLLLTVIAGSYLLFAVLMSAVAYVTERFNVRYVVIMPFLFFMLHAAYGLGTLKGFISALTNPLSRQKPGRFTRHSA